MLINNFSRPSVSTNKENETDNFDSSSVSDFSSVSRSRRANLDHQEEEDNIAR